VRCRTLHALGLQAHLTLAEAPHNATAMVLAVKPQQFLALKEEIKEFAPSGTLISIMAGIPLTTLGNISHQCARVMPNLPALVGQSMSVAYGPSLDEASRALVTRLFTAVGQLSWVDKEALLHSVTGISGSGPGYVFAFMEALEAAALAHGLDAKTARTLVMQTLYGAATLAQASPESFTTLRENVASPGGTTEAAFAVFSKAGLGTIVEEAVAACVARSKALSNA
jgi:pyrroline-5-carboxylate reductase